MRLVHKMSDLKTKLCKKKKKNVLTYEIDWKSSLSQNSRTGALTNKDNKDVAITAINDKTENVNSNLEKTDLNSPILNEKKSF